MNFQQQEIFELQSLPGLEQRIRQFRERPTQLHLLHGHSSSYLISLAISSALQQPFVVIDGATKFNSYLLSRIATFFSLPPRKVLQQTYLTRSFTAFQTEATITTKLPRFLASSHCRNVVILGLLDTYYDEQVRPAECRQSLQRILSTFQRLLKRNIHILIADVRVDHPPTGKEHLFQLIYNVADHVMKIQPEHNIFQLYEEKNNLWDATTIPLR